VKRGFIVKENIKGGLLFVLVSLIASLNFGSGRTIRS